MIVKYTKLKSKNLIVFIDPKVAISNEGNVIFTNNYTTKIRHMIHVPGKTLGYLDTIIVNKDILEQSFFPLAGVSAMVDRQPKTKIAEGQHFGIDFMKNFVTLRSRETDLEKSLKRILDLYTNLGCIYDSGTCVKDVKNARLLLGEIPPDQIDTYKEKWNERRNPEYFDINLKCFSVGKIIPICLRGRSGVEIELKEADVEHIINDLYEIYGQEMLINFIKNG